MKTQRAASRLEAAETRAAAAWRRVKYLRDSELYDYEVEDLYRIALREYQFANRALVVERAAGAARRLELLAA